MPAPVLVMDATVSLALLLREEEAARLEEQLAAFLPQGEIWAPALWKVEVVQGLVQALRRDRIGPAAAAAALRALQAFPLQFDEPAEAEALFAMAQEFGLSARQARYLELARRRRATLASVDSALREAAARASVPWIG